MASKEAYIEAFKTTYPDVDKVLEEDGGEIVITFKDSPVKGETFCVREFVQDPFRKDFESLIHHIQ